ncbi:MAG: NTP transferase domain-containing protein [Gluconacetobacter diazotrophicus]|nr:NTP transferase domain-containing protein [Gluconacetobacter diazotrophicus]
MQPTLLVLAAGMGSRYGGLKQLDPMGPSGETLLDYSVFDALRAGFGRVVFVIRRDFQEQFREAVGRRYEARTEVSYVFQELDDLPAPFLRPAARQKPWGTGHAIWCARGEVAAPFAAINADDFYGAGAYRALADFFATADAAPASGEPAPFAMVGYQLDRTLSEHGSVARGVCAVDARGDLQRVEECTGIGRAAPGGPIRSPRPDGTSAEFTGAETVSMNFWGFTPALFPLLETGLERFLRAKGDDPKAEYYIPVAVAENIAAGAARVRVLPTDAAWFGVTYREDKPAVAAALAALVRAGVYPADLRA